LVDDLFCRAAEKIFTMKIVRSFFFACSLLLISQAAAGQSKVFANADNVALNGYDVVAYFNAYQAMRGSKSFSTTHGGSTYYFSSAENLKSFQEKPDAYLPQYGGYCAFAMAMKGAGVPADPHTFKIHDGKLYLFFNDYYEGQPFNTIVPWNGSEKEMVAKADANWAKQ